jgi:autotransporter-associated beta strand protein
MARLAAPRRVLASWIAVAAVAGATSVAHAATLWWDNSGGTTDDWGSVNNWSTTSGGGSSPAAIPGVSDVATFNATSLTAAQTVNLNNNRSVQGLSFLSTLSNSVTLQGGGTNRLLEIGSSGVTNASEVAIAIGSGTANQNVAVRLVGSQSWANNGTQEIVVQNGVSGDGSPNLIFTNSGTGTGGVRFVGSIANSVSKLVQDSATSRLILRNTNAFTGGVEVKQGVLAFGNAGNNLGTGTLTLGVNGGTGAVRAEVQDNGNMTFNNAIVLATGHTGTITIRMLSDSGTFSKTFTGGITGANSFTIQNDGGANHTLIFNTNAINNAGTITHAGNGVTTINAVIGSNVTGLTQSSSSRLVLASANTYSGPTTISSGTLELGANGSFANSSTITVASGGRLNLEGKFTSGFTFGSGQTLAGAGSVALPTSGSGVSLAGFLAPGTVTAGTLAFTGAGTFNITSAITSQTGRLQFGLAAPGVSDLVTVASGTLAIGSGLLNFDDFAFTNLGGLNQGTYTLFSAATLSGSLGTSLSGSISGGYTGTLQTSGNTIQLVVVPEPAGIALAGIGVAAAALVRRLCRRDEPAADARS